MHACMCEREMADKAWEFFIPPTPPLHYFSAKTKVYRLSFFLSCFQALTLLYLFSSPCVCYLAPHRTSFLKAFEVKYMVSWFALDWLGDSLDLDILLALCLPQFVCPIAWMARDIQPCPLVVLDWCLECFVLCFGRFFLKKKLFFLN
jgi:hypothetical protein